jgi:photosystem II stability/assembly factor-like uncharacterized protein
MSIACLSTNATNSFALDEPVQTLFVATIDGVATLTRGADGTWQASGNALKGDHISALVLDAKSGSLLATRIPGSVQRSSDGGASWQDAGAGVKEGSTYSLRAFGDALYLGTEPVGLYRSTDGGESWTDLANLRDAPMHERWQFPSPDHDPHLKTLAVDPRDANVIYAGVEQGALLKSVDGGQSWRDLDEFVDYDHFVYKDIHQIALRPGNPDEVIITTGLGIFRSLNGGENWTQLTDSSFRIGYPDQLLFAPDDAQRMFVSGGFATPNFWVEQGTAKGTVMISEDGGQSWRAPLQGFPESRANVEALSVCAFSGGYDIFAGTTEGEIFMSADKGESWARIASGLAPIGKPTHDTLIAGMGYGTPEEALPAG